MILGKGAYGQVRKSGDYAIKSFHKLSHIIQEFAVGFYLRDCKGIIPVHRADYDKLELKMDFCDLNLSRWMEKKGNTHKDKMMIVHDILCGLTEMHKRRIVHGDIKPGNTVIKLTKDGPKAYICDLGFVSLENFSKVNRTTANYRDKVIIHGPSHDLYSLGILLLELFGDFRFESQAKYSEIEELVDKRLPKECKKIGKAILQLTQKDWKARPSVSSLLERFFKEDPTLEEKVMPDFDVDDNDRIKKWFVSVADKFKLNRAKRGYKCVLYYMQTYDNEKDKNGKLLTAVMLTIISSLFGESGFDEDMALKWCKDKFKLKDFHKVLAGVLGTQEMIHGLLLP